MVIYYGQSSEVSNQALATMRISCERCHSEYHLDDSQVRGESVEVQCSVCSHIFSVGKRSGPKSPSPAPEAGVWFVQTSDGNVQQFAGLAAVRQGLLEGRLTPQDKATRDQKTWQALGDAAELAPYCRSAAAPASREPIGCEPQSMAAAHETVRFVLEPKSHGFLKIIVGLAVAAGVAFAGIRWQQDRNLHWQSRGVAMTSHAAASSTESAPPTIQPRVEPVEEQGSPSSQPSPSSRPASRPVVEALPAPPPPREPAPKEATPSPRSSVSTPPRSADNYDKLVAEADRALENGANSKARELYQRAMNLKPTGAKAIVGLGFVALDRGQLSAAYDYFKRALTVRPSFPPAIFGIAEVHRARGEKELAIHSYQRYLDMSPNGTDAPAARRQIQSLQGGRQIR